MTTRRGKATGTIGTTFGMDIRYVARLYRIVAALGVISAFLYAGISLLGDHARTWFPSRIAHSDPFDMALLIPYFTVLIILASYGLYRYQLVLMYYKHREDKTTTPKSTFRHLPRVTIQLPVFNEQFSVSRLVESICKLEYPRELLEVQLLDDSTDETVNVAADLAARHRALGIDIVHIHRTDLTGFKAGALENGLKSAKGEFIAIFDTDFTPANDWIMKVIHHFAEPNVGMVQTRWTHTNRHYSFLTEVEAILLDGHFVLEDGGCARAGVFLNSDCAAGMWRVRAIKEAGGWQHDTLAADIDLSYRCQLKGWRFLYLQDVECPAKLPTDMAAFRTQQVRRATGLIQCAIKDLPRVMKAKVSPRQKIQAWYNLTASLSYPLMIMLSVLLMPAMVIRFYQEWFQMMYVDLPLFFVTALSISIFYLVSQRELFPTRWWQTFFYLPFLMALGIGLTITNSKGVIEALLGKESAFTRTSKYRVQTRGQRSVPASEAKNNRKRLGVIPWIELGVGSYFATTVWYAIANENYVTVPFFILFVYGYWYTGLMSLVQGRFELSGLADARSEAEDVKPFPVGV